MFISVGGCVRRGPSVLICPGPIKIMLLRHDDLLKVHYSLKQFLINMPYIAFNSNLLYSLGMHKLFDDINHLIDASN